MILSRTTFNALLALLLFSLSNAVAEQANSISLTFLPPDLEGRFSLGIYDADGKLVRILHSDAPESAFRIGLNGLITHWDGKDDQGRSLPAGSYTARGFVVGDAVDVDGEAFHFNDWIERSGIPSIQSIIDFRACEGGDVLVLADSLAQGRILGRVDNKKGFVWVQFVPTDTTLLAANSQEVFLSEKESCAIRQLSDGELLGSLPIEEKVAAATGTHLFVFNGKKGRALKILRTPGKTELQEEDGLKMDDLPFDIRLADGFEDGWWGGDGRDRCVLWTTNDGTKETSLTPLTTINRIASGTGHTLWAFGESEDDKNPVVAQFNDKGEALHVLVAESGWRSTNMSASPLEELVIIEETKGSDSRIRSLQQTRSEDLPNSGPEKWTVNWERKIQPCADFGLVDGRLVSDAGTHAPPHVIKVALQANPLEPDIEPFVLLSASVTPDGSWLTTGDGLPLLRVSAQINLSKGFVAKGRQPDEVRFFQGNAAVVEEFRIRNIDKMAAFDCGSFELTK